MKDKLQIGTIINYVILSYGVSIEEEKINIKSFLYLL